MIENSAISHIPLSSRRRAIRWTLPALLVLAACVYFGIRGPMRAAERSVDFPTFYSSSRAWLLGSNPYDGENLNEIYHAAGGDDQRVTLSLMPPAVLPLLAPISALPYQAGKYLVMGLNIALVVFILCMLVKITAINTQPVKMLLFIAAAVALAPFHTAISQGQLTIAATACIVGAFWFDINNRSQWAIGLLIALAAAIRPQMAIVFFLFFLLRFKWRICASVVFAYLLLTAAAVAKLEFACIDWLVSLAENLKTFTQGGTGDPSGSGTKYYLMINLHVLGHLLTPSRVLVNIIVAAVAAAGLAIGIVTGKKFKNPGDRLLTYSVLSVLTLLCVYHRIYSATLLVFPLAWAISSYKPAFRLIPFAALILIAAFFVPGAAALNTFVRSGVIPSWATETWWWNYIVMPHQIYSLLLLAILLGWASIKTARRVTDSKIY